MIEDIRLLFSKMNDSTRDEALRYLMLEFHLESPKFVKKNWVIGGRIPKENHQRVYYLFNDLLKEQMLVINRMEVIT
jgi:hypothetical protein